MIVLFSFQTQYRLQYPHLTEDQINQATRAYMMQIQSGFTGKLGYDKSHYAQEMARARMQQQQMYPGMYGSARGARPAEAVSSGDLLKQAQQLQVLQRLAQFKRQSELREQMVRTQQAAANNGASAATKRPSILSRPAKPRAPETITLDEDEDPDEISEVIAEEGDDDDGGEIMLDGAPEIAVSPFTSSL